MIRKLLLPLLAVAFLASVSHAQSGSIYGSVFDQESGEELIGANVLIMGTTMGAATDLDGKYTIRSVAPGTYTLRFSYVGYATKTVSDVVVTAGEGAKIDITLVSESFQEDLSLCTVRKA